jgi:hypothetical protein
VLCMLEPRMIMLSTGDMIYEVCNEVEVRTH